MKFVKYKKEENTKQVKKKNEKMRRVGLATSGEARYKLTEIRASLAGAF
jgi:hypothetical protein